MFFHAEFHLRTASGGVVFGAVHQVLGPLSGVPIFFILSGFLVSASFERHRDLRTYFRKRAVRIFPGLWVCLAVTLLLLGVKGYLMPVLSTAAFVRWIVAQATFAPFLHGHLFDGFGVGIPNGSLWTISVELSFYAAIPLLYLLIVDRVTRRAGNLIMLGLCAASFVLSVVATRLDPDFARNATKLLFETPAPYLYLFLAGVLAQRNYPVLARWVEGRWLWWIPVFYATVALVSTHRCATASGWCPTLDSAPQAAAVLASQVALVGLVLSLGFSGRHLAGALLRGTDVSYGTYLFHMLIVNLLVDAGITGHRWLIPFVIVASVAVGWVSWTVVENRVMDGGRDRRREASNLAPHREVEGEAENAVDPRHLR